MAPLALILQVFVRSLVWELHDLREALTLEQLFAVASSLVVLLPLLGAHGGEPAGQAQHASSADPEGQEGEQVAEGEQLRCICSPQQARELAAVLPQLAMEAVSRQELPAILVPVCQAYGCMLQLLQLTHTDPQHQHLTLEGAKDVAALHVTLSRTVLCAPRLAKQLGHVDMADLNAAVQVAVLCRLAIPENFLAVPSSFWEAVRKRVDELVWAASEGAVVALAPAAGAASAGQASGGAKPLDVQPLASLLEAMGRDMAAKWREGEGAPGGADKKTKSPGGAEAWLADTTTLLLVSHHAGMQDRRSGLVAAVASAGKQLAAAQRDLDAADSRRRALQSRLQQQQKQVAKRKKGKAGQLLEEQQQGEERTAEKELADAEEDCALCEVVMDEAREELKAKRSELQQLGVACLRQQLDVGALMQLARVAAEAAGGVAAAGGAGMGMGAALEGLAVGRLAELHAVQLVQVGGRGCELRGALGTACRKYLQTRCRTAVRAASCEIPCRKRAARFILLVPADAVCAVRNTSLAVPKNSRSRDACPGSSPIGKAKPGAAAGHAERAVGSGRAGPFSHGRQLPGGLCELRLQQPWRPGRRPSRDAVCIVGGRGAVACAPGPGVG